jgi:hypothetical protein
MIKLIAVTVLGALVGLGLGYYLGYGHSIAEPEEKTINSFKECADAGYPIAESYPEQCRTPDGKMFTRDVTPEPDTPTSPSSPYRPLPIEPVACPMDAKICPDGTGVGRTGPKCEFAPCPGE